MKAQGRKIEFSTSPENKVLVQTDGEIFLLNENNRELLAMLGSLIERQYPDAWKALSDNYKRYEGNPSHYLFLRVCRFILCNMGKQDSLSFDVDNGVLHIEDIPCPMRNECAWNGIVCHPKALNLNEREQKVISRWAKGDSYKEISEEMKVSTSSVKNTIYKAANRMKLSMFVMRKIAAAVL